MQYIPSDEDQPQPVKRTGSFPVPEGYRHLRNRRPPTLQREQESGVDEQSAPAHHHVVYAQPSPYYGSAPGGREYGTAPPPPPPPPPSAPIIYGYYPVVNPGVGWSREPYAATDARPPPPLRRTSREYLHETRREQRPAQDQQQQRRSAAGGPRNPYAAVPPPPVVREHTKSAPDEEDFYADSIAVLDERTARARSASLLSGSDSDSEEQFPYRRPSRRLHRSRLYDAGPNVGDSDSDAFDDYEGFLGTTKAFEFTPSRESSRSRIPSEDSAAGSDREYSPTRPIPSQMIDSVITDHKAGAGILNVYESRYTGDALSDGAHSVKLTVMHDSKSTRHRQPLFRWL